MAVQASREIDDLLSDSGRFPYPSSAGDRSEPLSTQQLIEWSNDNETIFPNDSISNVGGPRILQEVSMPLRFLGIASIQGEERSKAKHEAEAEAELLSQKLEVEILRLEQEAKKAREDADKLGEDASLQERLRQETEETLLRQQELNAKLARDAIEKQYGMGLKAQQTLEEERAKARELEHRLQIALEAEERRAREAEAAEQLPREFAERLKMLHEARRQKLLTLQERLLRRDSHVGLKDIEILNGKLDKNGEVEAQGFAAIVNQVKEFSSWDWKKDRIAWPHSIMVELTGLAQKRLQKFILGDLIWTMLFQSIFCSPFRLLGETGTNIEAEWNKFYAEGKIMYSPMKSYI